MNLLKIRKTEIILARSYLLTLMVFMENIQIFNCRSEKKSVFKVPGENNRFLIISIILTLCIQTLIVRVPELSGFFGLKTIEMTKIGALFLLTIPIIIVMEIFKKTRNVNIL